MFGFGLRSAAWLRSRAKQGTRGGCLYLTLDLSQTMHWFVYRLGRPPTRGPDVGARSSGATKGRGQGRENRIGTSRRFQVFGVLFRGRNRAGRTPDVRLFRTPPPTVSTTLSWSSSTADGLDSAHKSLYTHAARGKSVLRHMLTPVVPASSAFPPHCLGIHLAEAISNVYPSNTQSSCQPRHGTHVRPDWARWRMTRQILVVPAEYRVLFRM